MELSEEVTKGVPEGSTADEATVASPRLSTALATTDSSEEPPEAIAADSSTVLVGESLTGSIGNSVVTAPSDSAGELGKLIEDEGEGSNAGSEDKSSTGVDNPVGTASDGTIGISKDWEVWEIVGNSTGDSTDVERDRSLTESVVEDVKYSPEVSIGTSVAPGMKISMEEEPCNSKAVAVETPVETTGEEFARRSIESSAMELMVESLSLSLDSSSGSSLDPSMPSSDESLVPLRRRTTVSSLVDLS